MIILSLVRQLARGELNLVTAVLLFSISPSTQIAVRLSKNIWNFSRGEGGGKKRRQRKGVAAWGVGNILSPLDTQVDSNSFGI